MALLERCGIDLGRLSAWMDTEGLPGGAITDVTEVTGGTQNILLRYRRGERTYILRHPPEHKRTNSDETMRREARVLAALDGTAVPHPRLLAACAEEAILGSAFYLMEEVPGFNPTLDWPEPHRSDPARQRQVGIAMVSALAELSRVDVAARGLSSFGRPERWLERQVPRWRSQLESYPAMYGGATPDGVEALPHPTEVGAWLEANCPTDWTPGLIHGDYHFGNVLVDGDRGDIAAIVDWELCTIGDPLLDLGHMLTRWPGAPSARPFPIDAAALPPADELVATYEAVSGRSAANIRWYRTLACFRLAVLLEGTHARALVGQADPEVGARLHRSAVQLLEQAKEFVG